MENGQEVSTSENRGNVAPQLINLWLAAIFIVFDRVIANKHYLPVWFEFTEFTDASNGVACMSTK